MPLHKDLTDPEIHEPKGASSAALDTVLVITGSGTSSFEKIKPENIDNALIKNINRQVLSVVIPNPAVAFDYYIPIEQNKTLISVESIIGGSVAGASSITEVIKNSTPVPSGTITYPVSGTVAGSKTTATVNSALLTSDFLRLRSTATGVSSAGPLTILLTFSL